MRGWREGRRAGRTDNLRPTREKRTQPNLTRPRHYRSPDRSPPTPTWPPRLFQLCRQPGQEDLRRKVFRLLSSPCPSRFVFFLCSSLLICFRLPMSPHAPHRERLSRPGPRNARKMAQSSDSCAQVSVLLSEGLMGEPAPGKPLRPRPRWARARVAKCPLPSA